MFKKRNGHQSNISGASGQVKCQKLEELVLPTAKLRFCPDQLQNLNYIFQKKLQQSHSVLSEDKSLLLAKSVTERLVQRLLCCAGMLDSRFSSKFLISNHSQQNSHVFSRNLEYLVRLDCLSTPSIYKSDSIPRHSIIETDPDYPAAYARIRLHTTAFKLWHDCINSSGYLRRDKVQAKLVELLALAAANDMPNSPLGVDESVHCGVPGKVVDPAALCRILKQSADQHVFYGPAAGNVPRFPDPRDFRLAIVDEPDGIKLRVEFLSPALAHCSINVQIFVVVGVDAWPSSTNFPARIPLGHTDCLLYHHAAETGMYLVGCGVQSSAWQIRLPAAEYVLMQHYSPNSSVRTILDVLYDTLDEIEAIRRTKKQKQVSYKILNRHILLTILLKELEENSISPSIDLLNWSPMCLSTNVLKLLDKIMVALVAQNLSNYFFVNSNLMVNPGHLCDDDFLIESNHVKCYLMRLFDESLMSTKGNEEFDRIVKAQESEMILLYRWKELIDNVSPLAMAVKSRRCCFTKSRGKSGKDYAQYTQYSMRQLEYIGLLLKSVLVVKQNILQSEDYMMENATTINLDVDYNKDCANSHLEDIIYILVTIMDQARNQYLSNQSQTTPTKIKNARKIKSNYNTCTSKLVDCIRRDKDIDDINQNFNDDLVLVKLIIKWLYKAIEQYKTQLAPILRSYLNTLFITSHSISWYLEFIKQRMNDDELNALGVFAKLVNAGYITPAEGLIDAVNKNWNWAKSMLDLVEKSTLRVIFVSDRGKVSRHILSLPSYQKKSVDNNGSKTFTHSSNVKRAAESSQHQETIRNRSYFNTLISQKSADYSNVTPQHDVLKKLSPLTSILDQMHRKGEHRGYSDIFRSLFSMQKLSMFQEVTSSLPAEERLAILELIEGIQALKAKKSAAKKWSNTLPQLRRQNYFCQTDDAETVQRYTQKEESAGIRLDNVCKTRAADGNTLIRSGRVARIREDNSVLIFQDNFKIKSLLNNNRDRFLNFD